MGALVQAALKAEQAWAKKQCQDVMYWLAMTGMKKWLEAGRWAEAMADVLTYKMYIDTCVAHSAEHCCTMPLQVAQAHAPHADMAAQKPYLPVVQPGVDWQGLSRQTVSCRRSPGWGLQCCLRSCPGSCLRAAARLREGPPLAVYELLQPECNRTQP